MIVNTPPHHTMGGVGGGPGGGVPPAVPHHHLSSGSSSSGGGGGPPGPGAQIAPGRDSYARNTLTSSAGGMTVNNSTLDRHSMKEGSGPPPPPGGNKAVTPPPTPGKIGGKLMTVKVQMLDETISLFQIQVIS